MQIIKSIIHGLLASSLCLALSTQAIAAPVWKDQEAMLAARSEGSSLHYGDSLYVFNGFGKRIKIENSIERLDLNTGKWKKIASTSVAKAQAVTHNGLVRVGNEAWLIGGRVGHHPGKTSAKVWIYHLQKNSWRLGPELPVPVAGGGAALLNNKIHWFGGLDTNASCDVNRHFVYDLAKPGLGWKNLAGSAPMPQPRNHFATVAIGGFAYIIGGQFGHDRCPGKTSADVKFVHQYNANTNKWKRLADLPTVQSHSEPGTFVHMGQIYVVGGQTIGNKVLRYSPKTNKWATVATLPQPLLAPAATIHDGKLIVAGGGAPFTAKPINRVRNLQIEVSVGESTPVSDDPPNATDDTPLPASSNTAGLIVLEAEAHSGKTSTSTHQWINVQLAGSSNADAMVTAPDRRALAKSAANSPGLSWRAQFSEPGKYYVWVRGWGDTNTKGEGKNDSLHMGLNNKLSATADKIQNFPAGWHWSRQTRDGVNASLEVPSAGTHTVNVWMREDGLSIDKVVLTKSASYIPVGQGPSVADIDTQQNDTDNQNTDASEEQSDDADVTDNNSSSDDSSAEAGQSTGATDPLNADNEANGATADTVMVEAEAWTYNVKTGSHAWTLAQLGGASAAVTPNKGVLKHGTNGSPKLGWNVSFPSAGTWYLWVRGWGDTNQKGEGKNDSVHAGLNGKIQATADKIDGFPRGWSWSQSTRDGAVASITVPSASTHELNLWMREDGLAIDKLLLTRNKNFRPEGAELPVGNNSDAPVVAQNLAPSTNVGVDHDLDVGDVLYLDATVADDGKPASTLVLNWKKLSGAGSVTFGDSTSASTTATFSAAGRYVIQLVVSDTEKTSQDTMVVRVVDPVSVVGLDASTPWNWQQTRNGSKVAPRHEAGAVSVNGKLYVLGGRNHKPVQSWDPKSNVWKSYGKAPIEMHHFQPVAIDGRIYVIGAFQKAGYPREQALPNIYVLDTRNHRWTKGPKIPNDRLRGSAGAAVHNGKIYIVGGNKLGHAGASVNWLDEYDPRTKTWKRLPNAPRARDHATVAVANGKLVVAAGRRTKHPNVFGATESRTDVYNISTRKWEAGARNIPTPRAGTMTVAIGDEIVVIGGESLASKSASSKVEALNIRDGRWRTLQGLLRGRHSGGAAVLDGDIHVVSGNATRGGGNELNTHEIMRIR